MKRSSVVSALVLAAVAAMTAGGAWGGQPRCDARNVIIDHLERAYGEVVRQRGVTFKGTILEVLTSADGETWSIVITSPGGTACLVSAGEGWQSLNVKEGEGT